MASISGEDTAANGKWLAGHERVNAVDGPATEDLIDYSAGGTQEAASAADWNFPHRRRLHDLRAIEIRAGALFAEITNIGRCSRVCGREPAARRGAHRIDGLIVD